MRLDPAEVAELPFPAALVDSTGAVVAATPEWQGPLPGSLAYHTGAGQLLIGAGSPPPPEMELLMGRLLAALEEAVDAMQVEAALRASVLLAGLGLVSGRPLDDRHVGDTSEVLAYARAAIGMRAPALLVAVQHEDSPQPAPAPATIALALVQLAVNARAHQNVEWVRLRVEPGPSFYVEWPSKQPADIRVETARHGRWRARWGWGYVRLAADALGGVALPPGRTGPTTEAACFSIGSRMLTVPLACFEDGELKRCTQGWEQETQHVEQGRRAAIDERLAAVIGAAGQAPGQIAYRDLFSARQVGRRLWVALPPETGSQRVRDVLRGLDHERTLWSAPEPHATRAHALTVLLARAVGDPWPTFDPGAWARSLPAACAALDVPRPDAGGAAVYPDPRVAAYLLSELGGELAVRDEVIVYRPAVRDRLLGLLEPAPEGGFLLTPPLETLFR